MYDTNTLLKLMDVWNVHLKTWKMGNAVCNAKGMVKISEK